MCREIGRPTTASVVGSVNVSHVLTHGYVPRNMLESVIVPIIKDKNKSVSDLSNVLTKYWKLQVTNMPSPFLFNLYMSYIIAFLISRSIRYSENTHNNIDTPTDEKAAHIKWIINEEPSIHPVLTQFSFLLGPSM